MNKADLEASITFLTKAEGGRISPVWSGYRSRFCYEEYEPFIEHEYPDVDKVFPGESARVLLSFAQPEDHCSRLYKGMSFTLKDGDKTVAHGTIMSLQKVRG